VIDRVESLGQVDEDGCTVLSFIVGGYDIVYCNSNPLGSSILVENGVVRDGNFRIFGGLSKPGFRHGNDIRVGRVC
jgi:hypothetical protein